MALHPYRVRPGAKLPHEGAILEEGATVELSRRLGLEVRHLVDPIDAAGRLTAHPTPEQIELEERPAHERGDLLRRHRAALEGRRAELRELQGRLAADASATVESIGAVEALMAEIDAELAPQPAEEAAEKE